MDISIYLMAVVFAVLMCIASSNVLMMYAHAYMQSHSDNISESTVASDTTQESFTLCAISRVHNELRKVRSFIPHYLFEGFDFILLLDDRSEPPVHSTHPAVHVRRVDLRVYDKQYHILESYIQNELRNCSWVASVDIDELLTTRRNIHSTVREELLAMVQNKQNVYAINVPWIFFAYDKPVNDMALDMTCRWNHSLHHYGESQKTHDRYYQTGTKPLFRPQYCQVKNMHCLTCTTHQVEGVHLRPQTCNKARMHEEDIQQAVFALHHYRFLDRDDIRKKCMNVDNEKISSGYNVPSCVQVMEKSNHCEVKDEIMHLKYGKRGRDSSFSSLKHTPIHPAPKTSTAIFKDENQQQLQQQPFLCVISRVHNELRKVRSFVPHYLFEGFDFILLLDDRSEPPVHSTHPAVHVRRVDLRVYDKQYHILESYIQNELRNCSWVASVDIDELLTTRRHINTTVREELLAMHKMMMIENYTKRKKKNNFTHVNAINVPWIHFSFHSANNVVNNMALDMTCRRNHSLHHYGTSPKTMDTFYKIATKPLFRPQRCHFKNVHCLSCDNQVEGASGRRHGCNGLLFHEEQIRQAVFVIHHYRFLDLEDIRQKCKNGAFIGQQYNVKNCVKVMLGANYCEVVDDTMRIKYGKGGGEDYVTLSEMQTVEEDFQDQSVLPTHNVTAMIIVTIVIIMMILLLLFMRRMKPVNSSLLYRAPARSVQSLL